MKFYDIYDMAAMEELSRQVNGVLVMNPGDSPFVTTDGIHQVVKLKSSGYDLWTHTNGMEIQMNDMPLESAKQFLECR